MGKKYIFSSSFNIVKSLMDSAYVSKEFVLCLQASRSRWFSIDRPKQHYCILQTLNFTFLIINKTKEKSWLLAHSLREFYNHVNVGCIERIDRTIADVRECYYSCPVDSVLETTTPTQRQLCLSKKFFDSDIFKSLCKWILKLRNQTKLSENVCCAQESDSRGRQSDQGFGKCY